MRRDPTNELTSRSTPTASRRVNSSLDRKNMKSNRSLILSLLLFSVMATSAQAGWLIYHKPEFKGKVIDSETKEPIEGALVIAVYDKSILNPAGSITDEIKAKEVFTDKKGEYVISSYTTIIQPFSTVGATTFHVFKFGYKNPPALTIWALPEGLAYPTYRFSNALLKRIDDKWDQDFKIWLKEQSDIPEEKKSMYTRGNTVKYIVLYLPIVPMKNAKENLQSLQVPFFEIPEDVDLGRIKWIDRPRELYERNIDENSDYVVFGLSKAETRKELEKNIPSISGDLEILDDLPNYLRLRNEEEDSLCFQKTDLYKARDFIFHRRQE